MDTIFAEASPSGRGGVTVLRISGPKARAIAEDLVGALPMARHAYFRAIRDQGDVLDHALALRFDEGNSFTGEAVVELHLHGAPVIYSRVSKAIAALGARLAEPGEFTLRAFQSGRLDLAEAEGLSDLLAAQTEAQRRQAMLLADGALSRRAEGWRNMLLEAGALVVSAVDFADEDVPEDVPDEVFEIVAKLQAQFAQELSGFAAAARLRQGYEIAIVGPPNAGKSSLINYIAQRDIAIVTELPGTTRDILEYHCDLKGLPVTFLDMAGLRTTTDQVEKIGVDRALTRAEAADLRLFIGEPPPTDVQIYREGDFILEGKADLTGNPSGISTVTGQGIENLLNRIEATLSQRLPMDSLISHERQRDALLNAMQALDFETKDAEFVAEGLRVASLAIERLVGRIDTEDYLDIVFSRFCLGK